ncbi:hypothetical protein BT93_D1571 [Corymbia citriodora subsp. variegata]|nr:hypothetical protein BT93_D1571 [Corymbia citriodora subsp. variegata]
MSSASDTDLSPQVVSDQVLTGRSINDRIIPSLLDYFTQVKQRHIPPLNDDIAKASNLSVGGLSDSSGKFKEKKEKRTEAIDYCHHDDVNHQLWNQIKRLERDLGYVKDALAKLTEIEDSVGELIKKLLQQSKDAASMISSQTPGATNGNSKKILVQLSGLTEIFTKLKLQIPSPRKLSSLTSHAPGYVRAVDDFDDHKEMPDLNSVAKDLYYAYERLDIRSKQCLLCSAAFPESAKIKKRVTYHWWVGEELIGPSNSEDKSTSDILKEFVDMGFIQLVVKKRRMAATNSSYTMLLSIRSTVVILVKEAEFFEFDSRGYPTPNFSKCLRSLFGEIRRVFLAGVMDKAPISDLEKLHALFNVNEPYLDFKEEWFSNMKNINLLSLGSWQGSKHDHIEVEITEFLWGMKHMTSLKFFSLQGISRITELPKSIGKLYNLRILDLRDCHNLESLPNEICSLKELINLDVSGCYLIEYMPKGLDSLSKLEVLMGFVVSDLKSGSYSTLSDLAKLKKLRKLSISTTRKSFPTEEELMTLQKFGNLLKLTIAWGGNSISEKDKGAESASDDPITGKGIVGSFPFKKRTTQKPTIDDLKLPQNLEKLDLLCYPSTVAPKWLMPGKLENLKSLYVRGGYLQHLGRVQEDKKWKVKTMRLKFLKELAMDWREIRQSFPDLVCLQMVDCPRLTLFPCDKNGVWLKEQFSESNYKN